MSSDTIILRELHFVARHGLLPVESKRAQPFIVSLELETNLASAGRSDRLEDTVDYREVQRAVRDVIEGQSRRLIETLAETIASAVLAAAPRVHAVTVEVTKPRPPVDFQFAGVSVRIRREQADPPRTAFVALGSNLGDRVALLAGARNGLAAIAGTQIIASSGIFESSPEGVTSQPAFLNQVVAVETTRSPEELMSALLRIEAEFGRVRGERWGPRTLDLDLLAYEGETRATPFLQLPHPRLLERIFVTEPLRELLADARFAGWVALKNSLPPARELKRFTP